MRNYIKKNFYKFSLMVLMLALPILSLAQSSTQPPITDKIVNPLGTTSTLNGLIQLILTGAIKIGLPIVALAIVYCGFLFVQAQGKPQEIEKAKGSLMYTLIGAAILLGSWAIAQLIVETVKGL